jgi:hypothetical protein
MLSSRRFPAQETALNASRRHNPMSRYKGRVSARATQRDFPHLVETIVPELGKTLEVKFSFDIGLTCRSGRA